MLFLSHPSLTVFTRHLNTDEAREQIFTVKWVDSLADYLVNKYLYAVDVFVYSAHFYVCMSQSMFLILARWGV